MRMTSDGKFLPKWKKPAEETGRNRPGRNLVSATSGRNSLSAPKFLLFVGRNPNVLLIYITIVQYYKFNLEFNPFPFIINFCVNNQS